MKLANGYCALPSLRKLLGKVEMPPSLPAVTHYERTTTSILLTGVGCEKRQHHLFDGV